MGLEKITIPQDKSLDSSFHLLMEGYQFITNRCQEYRTNIFQTRILGQKVICMRGEKLAKLFYDHDHFQRHGAAPLRIQESLFGKDAVQTYDGAKHQDRKKLFMSWMTPKQMKKVIDITEEEWEKALNNWVHTDKIVLFHEIEKIMCQIACRWTGVPLWANELDYRTKDLSAMIDAFGAIGPRHWRGRLARNRTENWIRGIVTQVRKQSIKSVSTPLHAFSWHRNTAGNLLDKQMVAIELINLLRPIVAIARYVIFGTLALHQYPEVKQKIANDTDNYMYQFVQEIRRYYPFAPFVGARVRQDFTWNGHKFKQGTLVILDIYGTNHDPQIWEQPEIFQPERFAIWNENRFQLIPQGGGEANHGHRCAGEQMTIDIMKTSLTYLTQKMDYQLPEQNLAIRMNRIPALPHSRLIVANVSGSSG